MPIHDEYARVTPFELLMPNEEFPRERFPLIRQEAEGRGGSVDTPEAFLLLSETALALREIRGDDDPTEAVTQHGALLFQAFHFWEAGQPLYFLDTDLVRYLVDTGPGEAEWEPSLPGRGGYVQFPHHLVWASRAEGEPPESLDGIFWSSPEGENVTLLIVMGMRKDRPGLAVVPLPTLPMEVAAAWASMAVRTDGEDFRSSLPGAELEELYSIEAGGEAVKLAMRVFWYLDVFPQAVTEGAGTADGGPQEGGPRASSLPYRRVTLEGA
jgi:hypothetical protein